MECGLFLLLTTTLTLLLIFPWSQYSHSWLQNYVVLEINYITSCNLFTSNQLPCWFSTCMIRSKFQHVFHIIAHVSFFRSQNQVTFHYACWFLLEILDIFQKVKEDKFKDLIVRLSQLLSRDISFLQNTIINIAINYICCLHSDANGVCQGCYCVPDKLGTLFACRENACLP